MDLQISSYAEDKRFYAMLSEETFVSAPVWPQVQRSSTTDYNPLY